MLLICWDQDRSPDSGRLRLLLTFSRDWPRITSEKLVFHNCDVHKFAFLNIKLEVVSALGREVAESVSSGEVQG